MKRIIFIFILVFSNIYSQNHYVKLPLTKNNCPTFIIEKEIIANENVIATAKESIDEISVLKDKSNRKKHKFFNLTENGIIFIRLKQKIAFKTQSELNDFFGLKKNNEVYVNGYLIEKSNYKIATDCIVEIELVEPDLENKLKHKVVNVWTLTKEKRINGCDKHNVN
ncbi:hypothetical protein ACSIGC_02895 [Tenacibaculum sp. ZS6-P6]|uniref:hypothetical protein n=1 Tax=Tenacibaculum sp. ZS6-P6 TaxID=3447503 RepID=UPI003F94F70D